MRLVTFRTAEGERVGELVGDTVETLRAPTMIAWLSGEGRERAGIAHALADVELAAPVPTPPSLRDFFCFEEHVRTGARLRGGEIPEAWYAAPAFYFSNPASVVGPGARIRKPPETELLDFELEIAAVIGGDGAIAGFTLLNDWSARDLQRAEMTVGLGPAKGKDFATSLGPWLVTPDELPYADGRLDVEAAVTVNGVEITRARTAEQHFGWDEVVAHAARNTALRAGDVLGSGTLNRGCLLELGPLPAEATGGEPRALAPGDVVVLSAEGLGELDGSIV